MNAAKNPSTPVSVLEKLLYNGNTEILKAIVDHPNVSILILEKLSKDRENIVRELVARKKFR